MFHQYFVVCAVCRIQDCETLDTSSFLPLKRNCKRFSQRIPLSSTTQEGKRSSGSWIRIELFSEVSFHFPTLNNCIVIFILGVKPIYSILLSLQFYDRAKIKDVSLKRLEAVDMDWLYRSYVMEHVIGISMLYQWPKKSVMNIPFNLEYPFVWWPVKLEQGLEPH